MKTEGGSLVLMCGRNAQEGSCSSRLEEAIYDWWYEAETSAGVRSVGTLNSTVVRSRGHVPTEVGVCTSVVVGIVGSIIFLHDKWEKTWERVEKTDPKL